MFVFVFFFFKQKTAYEVRISDWSSDVCSSDLMSQTALRIGIVLVGARITAEQLVELGPLPFAMLVLIMLAVIVATVAAAPLFRQDKQAALLAGGATAICGASAALALYSLIGDKHIDQARFTLTLVGITVASALAMTLYPVLASQLRTEEHTS